MNTPSVICMFALIAIFGVVLTFLATREEHRADRQSRDPSRVASHRPNRRTKATDRRR